MPTPSPAGEGGGGGPHASQPAVSTAAGISSGFPQKRWISPLSTLSSTSEDHASASHPDSTRLASRISTVSPASPRRASPSSPIPSTAPPPVSSCGPRKVKKISSGCRAVEREDLHSLSTWLPSGRGFDFFKTTDGNREIREFNTEAPSLARCGHARGRRRAECSILEASTESSVDRVAPDVVRVRGRGFSPDRAFLAIYWILGWREPSDATDTR